ncbi:hypothetical protein FGO68_gene1849 [Halteria grandinella]|uniref:Uncharacterized protein n=1 Tax=Halteria grandinella TaxID=5974 RepID=A0A8J8T4Z4_HALGN|nr:hypothetical protein FGO68_gene1849 [Halteria grandinella]
MNRGELPQQFRPGFQHTFDESPMISHHLTGNQQQQYLENFLAKQKAIQNALQQNLNQVAALQKQQQLSTEPETTRSSGRKYFRQGYSSVPDLHQYTGGVKYMPITIQEQTSILPQGLSRSQASLTQRTSRPQSKSDTQYKSIIRSTSQQEFKSEYLRQLRERQEKEAELQTLKNRVALLEQQEAQARKRTMQTKKKAADIFFSKVLNEDKIRDKLKQQVEQQQQIEHIRLKIFHQKEVARREQVQREIDKQRLVQSNAVVRMLIKEANQGKRQMEGELTLEEAREKKEQIRLEEAKARETLERYREIRESQNRGARERRIQIEKEQTIKTVEEMKALQKREQELVEKRKHTQTQEYLAQQLLQQAIYQTNKSQREISAAMQYSSRPDNNQLQRNISQLQNQLSKIENLKNRVTKSREGSSHKHTQSGFHVTGSFLTSLI